MKKNLKSSQDAKKRIEELRERAAKRRADKERDEDKNKDSGGSSKRAFNSGSDRFARYADGLLRIYDKDKDGSLSKDEVKKMRNPPSGADSNKDGVVTRDELIASVSGGGKSSSSSSKSTGSRSKSSSKRRVSSSFPDQDGDGQIKMHEYANGKPWTDALVAEFVKKDLNNDGVITSNEWRGRRD